MSSPIRVCARPSVDAVEASILATSLFGCAADSILRELGSNQDRNFLARAPAGSAAAFCVLKVSNSAVPRERLEAQCAALEHVRRAGVLAPLPLRALSGDFVVQAPPYFVRPASGSTS
jgi:Ser/Thr protein kinase RdoA (MazF antagonist)